MIVKCLVLSTLPRKNAQTPGFLHELAVAGVETAVMYEEDYHIEGCKGCTLCWLKTPGKCVVRDDYELVFKEILNADMLICLSESKLGFVSYKLKNIIDRIIPLATPYLEIRDGECRHVPRYKKVPKLALVYAGEENSGFLIEWLGCVAKNLGSASLGAHHYTERQVLINAINNI